MKHFTLIILACLSLFACKQTPKTQTAEIKFETMGTFGTVKIVSDSLDIDEAQIANNIDSIFIDFNMSLSTYIDSSLLSRYSQGEEIVWDEYLNDVIGKSEEITFLTKGTFNPKGKVLFEYWQYLEGEIDSSFIDSLVIEIVDFYDMDTILRINPITLEAEKTAVKIAPRNMDFSAIAKGYGVDVIANYLASLGYTNYMVEIGGEVVCRGVNATGDLWRLGIEEPNEEVRSIYEVVALNNQAMATSGNYRNFKVLESGQKVVHIINPKTGYPEISNLLSASIIADDCMSADAYATACMVMGLDTCFQFVLNHPELECYLIYSKENGELQTKFTDGFGEALVE